VIPGFPWKLTEEKTVEEEGETWGSQGKWRSEKMDGEKTCQLGCKHGIDVDVKVALGLTHVPATILVELYRYAMTMTRRELD
jgi:hypothetical protein